MINHIVRYTKGNRVDTQVYYNNGKVRRFRENSYSETVYGVDEFDANDVIQLSDAIEIVDKYLSGSEE